MEPLRSPSHVTRAGGHEYSEALKFTGSPLDSESPVRPGPLKGPILAAGRETSRLTRVGPRPGPPP